METMSSHRNGHRPGLTMHALSQREIDEWIQHLVVEVAAESLGGAEAEGSTQQPRWIPPGELVRRMSRFLCTN